MSLENNENGKIHDIPFGQLKKGYYVKLKSSKELAEITGLYWNTNEVALSNGAVIQMREIEYVNMQPICKD